MTKTTSRRLLIFIVPGLAMIMAVFLAPIQALAQTDTPTPTATPAMSASWNTDLVACWPMDESEGTRADIVGGADLTDNNTVGSTAGKFSSAASFDAANFEYLSRNDSAIFNTSNQPFTLAGWMKENLSGGASFVGVFAEFYIGVSSGAYWRLYHGSSNAWLDALSNPSNNTWAYIIAWGDPSGKYGLSINGIDATKDYVSYNETSYPFYVGRIVTAYLTGAIDDLAYWNRALTAGDRYHLYNAGNGRSCYELASLPTPTPTITPSGSVQVGLSSGDWMTVQRQASYGDVALAIVGMAGLAVLILYLIVRLSKLWVN